MVVRRSREEWKTYGNVFDKFTLNNLNKLSGQGYFTELTSSIALGKEANIFGATTEDGGQVIIKIYRLENCNFNKMYEYISQDTRYDNLKGDKRRIIFAWTQREYRNILKAREVIRTPTPLAFKDNILIMEYIEDHDTFAPKLKDVEMEAPEEVFDSIIDSMKQLFEAELIHGDLSEYNILMQYGEPVFIDFSQTTSTKASNAKELMLRDIEVLCKFFKKRGLKRSVNDIFKQITGKDA